MTSRGKQPFARLRVDRLIENSRIGSYAVSLVILQVYYNKYGDVTFGSVAVKDVIFLRSKKASPLPRRSQEGASRHRFYDLSRLEVPSRSANLFM